VLIDGDARDGNEIIENGHGQRKVRAARSLTAERKPVAVEQRLHGVAISDGDILEIGRAARRETTDGKTIGEHGRDRQDESAERPDGGAGRAKAQARANLNKGDRQRATLGKPVREPGVRLPRVAARCGGAPRRAPQGCAAAITANRLITQIVEGSARGPASVRRRGRQIGRRAAVQPGDSASAAPSSRRSAGPAEPVAIGSRSCRSSRRAACGQSRRAANSRDMTVPIGVCGTSRSP